MIDYNSITNKVSHIILNTTNQCNFRCRMCFCDWNEHYMTPEIADRAIELGLSMKNPGTKKLRVAFFGGEPLLNLPLIAHVVDRWADECHFSITTNGSLITPRILDFLKEKDISILLSIDGDKKTQDYNRPFKDSDKSTFDVLAPKLPFILEAFPNTTFRSTIIPETVEYLFENYMFAKRTGFKSYFCIPDAYSNWTPEKQKVLGEEVSKITEQIAKDIAQGETLVLPKFVQDGLIDYLEIHGDIPAKKDNGIRCGLGVTGFGVGATGIVTGCQEHSTILDENDKFVIGNVWDGISEEKHAALIELYSQEREEWKANNCLSCKLQSRCIDKVCPSRQDFISGHFNTITPADCLWMRCCFLSATLLVTYFSRNYSKNFSMLLEHLLNKKKLSLGIKEVKTDVQCNV